MRVRKINKKLSVKRETIANLNNKQMNRINGGTGPTFCDTVCDWTEGPHCTMVCPETDECPEPSDCIRSCSPE